MADLETRAVMFQRERLTVTATLRQEPRHGGPKTWGGYRDFQGPGARRASPAFFARNHFRKMEHPGKNMTAGETRARPVSRV
jgi:hypothetical protein